MLPRGSEAPDAPRLWRLADVGWKGGDGEKATRSVIGARSFMRPFGDALAHQPCCYGSVSRVSPGLELHCQAGPQAHRPGFPGFGACKRWTNHKSQIAGNAVLLIAETTELVWNIYCHLPILRSRRWFLFNSAVSFKVRKWILYVDFDFSTLSDRCPIWRILSCFGPEVPQPFEPPKRPNEAILIRVPSLTP